MFLQSFCAVWSNSRGKASRVTSRDFCLIWHWGFLFFYVSYPRSFFFGTIRWRRITRLKSYQLVLLLKLNRQSDTCAISDVRREHRQLDARHKFSRKRSACVKPLYLSFCSNVVARDIRPIGTDDLWPMDIYHPTSGCKWPLTVCSYFC